MREIGLIFRDWGVRAILEGRKTQTRRTGGLSAVNLRPERWQLVEIAPSGNVLFRDSQSYNNLGEIEVKPRLRVGDVMYAREVWRTVKEYDDVKPSELPGLAPIRYKDGHVTGNILPFRLCGEIQWGRT